MIAIIASMYMEAHFIVENMTEVKKHEGIFTYFTGKQENKDIIVAICHTGKVHMALCAQHLIDKYNISHLFCIGTSGSLDKDLDIGDVVVARDVVQHDMDVSAFGYDMGVIPDIDVLRFVCDKNICKNLVGEKFDSYRIKEGTIVSGDLLVGNDEKKKWLKDTFAGLCAEMEGGALGQVAFVNKIPFNIIRGISDKADEGAADDFTDNIKLSSDNAAKTALLAIKYLS